ncbi:MAG: LysR family transcriptional regulator [Phenylobacterium sp.]|uniref:LysR family transcriptional regulator n=1 Tax=Phenylobacterium sp. TaxID=1871053 RepID=UPI001218ABCA|nr:LysR family transcriptional regulator [Phenylobacterium sp.]TAJ69749.1 MAG: LysR family transcriptional regulator [Phenylobacterium sp.]
MPRAETNRSGEMEVFVRVVEYGGFSAAARSLRMTPSAVSKLIGRLEERLGARLFARSTRRLQLTSEGAAFHERAVRVLADLEEAERAVTSGARPQGRVRVNSNVAFGQHHLVPIMPGFLAAQPEILLDLALSDVVIDLMGERADVAIRTGPLQGSQLTARKLGESRMVVVASPAYLAAQGTPASVEDLERHNRIGFNFARAFEEWPFRTSYGDAALPACGNAKVGDGETARRLALEGVGVARLALWHVGADIAAGRLVPVLEDMNPRDIQAVHAVYIGGRGDLPARVRAFIDYLVEHIDLSAATRDLTPAARAL